MVGRKKKILQQIPFDLHTPEQKTKIAFVVAEHWNSSVNLFRWNDVENCFVPKL